MNTKNISSMIVTIIGIFGTFVGVIALDNSLLKQFLITVFAALTLFGIFSYVFGFIDIFSAWSILTNVKKLGVKRIYIEKISDNFSERLSNATRIRIMVLSGGSLISHSKNEIIQALVNKKPLFKS